METLQEDNQTLKTEIMALNKPETVSQTTNTEILTSVTPTRSDPDSEYNIHTENKYTPLIEINDCDLSETSTSNQNEPESSTNASKTSTPRRPLSTQSSPRKVNKLIVLSDSNGKYLNPGLLCPEIPVDIHKCTTISKARNILSTLTEEPKIILLHCGTNDIENLGADDMLKAHHKLIEFTTSTF